jgi:hypothetical protein
MITAMRVSSLLSLLVVGANSLGCLAQVGESVEEEPIGESQSALSGRWYFSWGTTDGPELDTHVSTSQATCFLSGVAGNLGAGDKPSAANYDAERSEASVFEMNGTWRIHAQGGVRHSAFGPAPVHNPVLAHVTCIPVVAGRTDEVTQWTNANPTNLGPVTSRRQCFLTAVEGIDGSWTDKYDSVRVWNDGSSWWLGGIFPDQMYGALGRARCVDMPSGTHVTHGHWRAPASGTLDFNLTLDSNHKACMLTGIQGRFTANDWDDGVLLSPPDGPLSVYWTAHLENGKELWDTCVD